MDYARLVQSWLYFGFLPEYSEEVVNPLDFLYVTPDHKRLVRSSQFMENPEPQESDKIRLLLADAKRFLFHISRIPYATQDPLSIILLSVSVLIGSLDEYSIFGDSSFHLEQDLPQTWLLAERMSSIGWCPHHIRRICGTLSPDKAYFISFLNRHERPGIDHSLCSETSCTANDVNEETYETLHASQDCQCSMVGVDEARLAEILRQGKIPIVRVETDRTTNRPRLKLIATSMSNKYVAVSHVWADGLGNPRSNSLPQCQIKRLARQISALPKGNKFGTLFNQLHSSGYFWADWVPAIQTASEDLQQTSRWFWMNTLCVPMVNRAFECKRLTKWLLSILGRATC
ncbi:hypothetical protein F4776DRAFT_617959 [Hypoxylon sp. NC0597]|nr:hypothetical protein F4776DRAFT_617959 [Hypoxylon sp. NC0597]